MRWLSIVVSGVAVASGACATGTSSTTFPSSSGTGGGSAIADGANHALDASVTGAGGTEVIIAVQGDGAAAPVDASGGGIALDAAFTFDVDPSTLQTVVVHPGQPLPTVMYHALVGGAPVAAGWSVDRGEIGSMSESGLFTPRGSVGGYVTVRAGLNGQIVERQILVQIVSSQNGPGASPGQQALVVTDATQLHAGGGVGGVGGEGLGTAVSDPALVTALGQPVDDGTAQQLRLLYPYDKTVWPRGMLPPLLQWSWSGGNVDAIKISLKTKSGAFAWEGSFARPAILTTQGGAFVRHPLPPDVWQQATDTAGADLPDGSRDTLDVALTVASAGAAHGPVRQTWNVAPGRLSGTVYYNSYGTRLVTNYQDFGAAVLGIKSGATAPSLVAGANGTGGCRVCHTLSARGNRMVVQRDNNTQTSLYDLTGMTSDSGAGAVERYLSGQDGVFGWAGLSPDGSYALTNAQNLSQYNVSVAGSGATSALFSMNTNPPQPVSNSGLPTKLVAALPVFSPDGKKVAFGLMAGTGAGIGGEVVANGSQIVTMDFDSTAPSFSNLRWVVNGDLSGGRKGAGFPSFTPGSDALIYENELRGNNDVYIGTRNGARGELWWVDLATRTPCALAALNGKDITGTTYLPLGPNGHGSGATDGYDDSSLNYEPTVNPVTTGGYMWVVFTSRRLYGNVAVSDPFKSDPRDYNYNDPSLTTTKKLWVAAIDLAPRAGTDPSHPAFYLPAQELLAGNARGYWVLDPCRTQGTSCETGDQCCGGFCQPNGQGGALVCSDERPSGSCSRTQEKCTTKADCCNPKDECIGGFCATKGLEIPPPR